MRVLLFLFILITVVLSRAKTKHKCGHTKLKEIQGDEPFPVYRVEDDGIVERRKTEDWESIRIGMYVKDLEDQLTTAKYDYVISVLGKAKEVIENLLNVERASYLTLPTLFTKCGEADVPSNHRLAGNIEGYDYYLYIVSKDTSICKSDSDSGTTIAYAGHCVQRIINNQPTIGYVNLCSSQIPESDTDDYSIEQYVRVVVHEMFHALGYTNSLFDEYPGHTDAEGYPTPNYLQTFSYRGKSGINFFTGPKTKELVNEHFGCNDNSIPGLELEDYGGSGTAGSHSEERVYFDDFMNGQISFQMVYSKFSISVLHDSGWYIGNFDNTEKYYYGRDGGCDFAIGECITNGVSNGPKYTFCTESDVDVSGSSYVITTPNGCTYNRGGAGYCLIWEYSSNLAEYDQHFNEPNVGGNEISDFCPIYDILEYSTGGNSDCWDKKNNEKVESAYMQIFGSNSACFENDVINTYSYPGQNQDRASCFSYSCVFGDGEEKTATAIKIMILSGNEITCTPEEENKKKSVGVYGGIVCPDYDHYDMLCDKEGSDKENEVPDGSGSSFLTSICPIYQISKGTALEGEIWAIRSFRDNVLSKSVLGRKLITLYYKYGNFVNNVVQSNWLLSKLFKFNVAVLTKLCKLFL